MLPSVIIFHSLFCVSQKVDRWNRLRANGWIHSYGGLVGSDSAKMGSTPETLWPEASVAAGQYLVRNPKLSKTWIRIILFFWLFSKDNNNKKKNKKTRRRIKTTDSSSSFLMIMPPLALSSRLALCNGESATHLSLSRTHTTWWMMRFCY